MKVYEALTSHVSLFEFHHTVCRVGQEILFINDKALECWTRIYDKDGRDVDGMNGDAAVIIMDVYDYDTIGQPPICTIQYDVDTDVSRVIVHDEFAKEDVKTKISLC